MGYQLICVSLQTSPNAVRRSFAMATFRLVPLQLLNLKKLSELGTHKIKHGFVPILTNHTVTQKVHRVEWRYDASGFSNYWLQMSTNCCRVMSQVIGNCTKRFSYHLCRILAFVVYDHGVETDLPFWTSKMSRLYLTFILAIKVFTEIRVDQNFIWFQCFFMFNMVALWCLIFDTWIINFDIDFTRISYAFLFTDVYSSFTAFWKYFLLLLL